MNSRFTIAAGVALLGMALFGCATSPEAKRDRYLARGKALVEKKDYMRAILEFRNAARAMPQDAETYYQIGIAYLATTDIRTGYAALKKAVELNPKHQQAQLRLAQLLSMTSDPELLRDAERRLQALLGEGASGPEVLNALAFTELQLGRTEDAIRDYETALAQFPGELTASLMLARTKLAQGDATRAEEILRNACSSAPKSADARTLLADFYIHQKRTAAAEAELRTAISLDPKSGRALLTLARLLLTADRKQEAEDAFKRVSNLDGYQHMFAIFLLDQRRNDEAVREFERLAKRDPDDRVARTRLVAVYRRLGRFADADAVLSKALEKNAKDADALLQRAEVFLEARKFGAAEVDVNQVLKLKPKSAEAHYLAGKLHEGRGDKRLYRQELNEALNLNPALEAVRLELVRDLIRQKDGKSALDVLNAAPPPQNRSLAVLVEKNWAWWTLGEMPEMRRGIDLLLASNRQLPEALIQDGMWKMRSGDRKGARESAEQALRIDPDNVAALQVLNQTYLPQEPAGALEKVKDYAAQRPRSAAVQEFLGLMLMGNGRWEEARTAFTAAQAEDPNNEKIALSLAQVDVVQNKLDDAKTRLHNVLQKNAKNVTARRWLGNIEAVQGNKDAAIDHFRKALEQNSGDAQAANNLAYLLTEHQKNPDEALKYAQQAVELANDRPAYLDTLGWAYYNRGLYTSAIPYLERASATNENVIYSYHLSMAYAKAGDVTRARSIFTAAKMRNAKVPEAKAAEAIIGSTR